MNEKTKVMYNLARMYEYVRDIDDLCEKNNYDIESLKDELRVEEDLKIAFQKDVDTLNEEDALRMMKGTIERDGIKVYE